MFWAGEVAKPRPRPLTADEMDNVAVVIDRLDYADERSPTSFCDLSQGGVMTPTMIRQLAALGLSITQIAGVMEIFDTESAERRAKVAARMQRYREGKARRGLNVDATTTLRSVTVDPHAGVTRVEDNLLSKEITGQNKKEEKKASLSKSARGTRLSADFVPEPGIASTLGLTRAEFAVELPLFRDYWTAKAGPGAIKMDWQATWRNWCRKVVKDRRPQARNGPAPPDKPQSIGEMFRQEAREKGILHDEHSDPLHFPVKRVGSSH